MSIENIMNAIQEKAVGVAPLGSTIKFDFGEKQLFLDGTGEANKVSMENKEAACTVKISEDNFKKLIGGDLNPMSALMTGKLKIKGDMGVAMKLQSLFA